MQHGGGRAIHGVGGCGTERLLGRGSSGGDRSCSCQGGSIGGCWVPGAEDRLRRGGNSKDERGKGRDPGNAQTPASASQRRRWAPNGGIACAGQTCACSGGTSFANAWGSQQKIEELSVAARKAEAAVDAPGGLSSHLVHSDIDGFDLVTESLVWKGGGQLGGRSLALRTLLLHNPHLVNGQQGQILPQGRDPWAPPTRRQRPLAIPPRIVYALLRRRRSSARTGRSRGEHWGSFEIDNHSGTFVGGASPLPMRAARATRCGP